MYDRKRDGIKRGVGGEGRRIWSRGNAWNRGHGEGGAVHVRESLWLSSRSRAFVVSCARYLDHLIYTVVVCGAGRFCLRFFFRAKGVWSWREWCKSPGASIDEVISVLGRVMGRDFFLELESGDRSGAIIQRCVLSLRYLRKKDYLFMKSNDVF